MGAVERNNVRLEGKVGGQPMLFAHGFGCDQNMWRYVWPAFADEYRIILFDHVGSGRSDLSAYERAKYDSLQGYADDVVDICRELELRDAVFVGHSVASMIGVLAVAAAPDAFAKLVLVSPSPRYMDDEATGYVGGFTREDIEGLLDSLDSNFLGWSAAYAPAIMGSGQPEELQEELTNSFCATDPEIARHFARVTFLSDNRADLPAVHVPTLVLQCADDIIAPQSVGDFVAATLPRGTLVNMQATGHCPNLSAPAETVAAIRAFL